MKPPMQRPFISRQEWIRVFWFTATTIILTTIPYIIAWQSQGDNWIFNGFLFGVEDGNAYLGKMRLGARGLWDFFLFYTPENHDSGSLLYIPYIITGQLIKQLNISDKTELFSTLVIAFNGLRILFNVCLILIVYRFIAVFIKLASLRILTLFFAIYGGGFGWLLLFRGNLDTLSSLPPEFYIPEGFSLLVILGLPHIALARAALLGGFLAIFHAQTAPRSEWYKWSFIAGACWIIVGLGVSFYLIILYAIIGVWGLALWARNREFPLKFALRCGLAVIITLPLFLYYLFIFTQNEAFATWSSQNLLPSPPLVSYFLAYGILGIFTFIGSRWAWKKHPTPEYLLLIGWVSIVPILVHLPINVQRRLAESVLIPLAILTVIGMRLMILPIASRFNRSPQYVWRILHRFTILALTLSSFLFLTGMYFTALSPSYPLFREKSEIAALDWLIDYAEPNEIVFSSITTGNFIPTYTNLRVFIGHNVETIKASDKENLSEQFFNNDLTIAQQQVYTRNLT